MSKGTCLRYVENISYQYVTNSDTTITPSAGVYKFSSVPIYEGSSGTFKYTVDVNDVTKIYNSSDSADTSTVS